MRKNNPPPIRVAALVLMEQDGQYLLIRESKAACWNTWFLPGGRALADESLPQAAVREVREESGILADLTGLLNMDQRIESAAAGIGNRIRFVFLGIPAGGALKQAEDEHSSCAGWFSEGEIGNLQVRSPFVRKMIALHRGDPAMLPVSKVHALTPKDLLLERP